MCKYTEIIKYQLHLSSKASKRLIATLIYIYVRKLNFAYVKMCKYTEIIKYQLHLSSKASKRLIATLSCFWMQIKTHIAMYSHMQENLIT